MPGAFIAAIVFLATALLALGIRAAIRPSNQEDDYARRAREAAQAPPPPPSYSNDERIARRVAGWMSVGLAGICVVLLFASSYNPVSTKNEGIVTTFGATSGHLDNGFHLTWPWQKVREMDAATQTDTHAGGACDLVGGTETDENGENVSIATDCKPSVGGGCILVRIANQQTACADISIQWRIKPEAADSLYKDFRSFEHVRDALVTRKLQAATNAALAALDPLNSIATEGKAASKETLAQYSETIKATLVAEVGDQAPDASDRRIVVLSVLMPIVKFDKATQGRINQLQQQVALTRIAKQEKLTNVQKALANRNLSASVNNSPNVLVARCLDLLDTMVKAGQAVPAGFSCWPGGSGVGVFVQGDKKAAATP